MREVRPQQQGREQRVKDVQARKAIKALAHEIDRLVGILLPFDGAVARKRVEFILSVKKSPQTELKKLQSSGGETKDLAHRGPRWQDDMESRMGF